MPHRTPEQIIGRFGSLKQGYITASPNRPFTRMDVREIEDMISQVELDLYDDMGDVKKALGYSSYKKALGGDFSEFERVHPVLRNYCAMKAEASYRNELKDIEEWRTSPYEEYRDLVPERLRMFTHNPAVRLGMSIMREQYPYYQQLDDKMIDMIMEDTLRPMTDRQVERVSAMAENPDHAREMIDMNVEKQVQVAKMMLMAHLGDTKLMKDGQPVEMERSVSSMMAHCSRAAFVFPAGDQKEVSAMMGQLTGAQMGKGAGVYGRFAATHSTAHGQTIEQFKEKKGVSFRHQYGMDIAIGGLGNDGIRGKESVPQTLKNDGTCGHMYMRVDPGGEKKTSSLLIGFESDSPSAVGNQQGHTHTASAAPEYMSSFLGQRVDEMGDKYGGRIVDCTQFSPQELTEIVENFASQYRGMIHEAMKNPQARMRLEQANEMLSGKLMNGPQMETFFNKAGFSMEQAQRYTQMAAAKKKEDFMLGERDHKIEEPVPALKEVEKPGKRNRVRAFFGSSDAKQKIQDFQQYQKQKQEMSALAAHKAMANQANAKSLDAWNKEQTKKAQERSAEEKKLEDAWDKAKEKYDVYLDDEKKRLETKFGSKRGGVAMTLDDLMKEEAASKPKRSNFKQVREEWMRNKPARDMQAADENLREFREAQNGPKKGGPSKK